MNPQTCHQVGPSPTINMSLPKEANYTQHAGHMCTENGQLKDSSQLSTLSVHVWTHFMSSGLSEFQVQTYAPECPPLEGTWISHL